MVALKYKCREGARQSVLLNNHSGVCSFVSQISDRDRSIDRYKIKKFQSELDEHGNAASSSRTRRIAEDHGEFKTEFSFEAATSHHVIATWAMSTHGRVSSYLEDHHSIGMLADATR